MSQNFQPPAPASYTEAPAPAPARGNVGLGIVAAVVAALVAIGVYGAIIKGTEREIGYAAVGVGALIGFAAGKVGGRNAVLPVLGALLSVVAVLAGQMFGLALIAADALDVSAVDILLEDTSALIEAWKTDANPLTYLFLAIGGYAAFQVSRKIAD
ncbi:hypothetical protein [Streptomyces sp. RerS4]|uniref:hypothetical protein n=1 Tax=Streptomyces sp. RerS4 TaxID=2942449 RepID=UPI00201C988E|nr:hypothetical protein [Streptomyces sp. RerS4]UQX02589.1 hypothetical protein M4D82_20370 [Streptomyces sp. RerS4]